MSPDARPVGLSLLSRRLAHYLIRAYQLSLSAFIGRACRHEPSCSAYADEAIQRHGLMAGGLLGVARICRCNPWGTWGYDPVPETFAPLRQQVGERLRRRGRRFDCTPQAPSRRPPG